MNHYSLSRSYFDWTFENPSKVKPVHTAIYFFCIEHCNRLGWKKEFGFPTTMAMDAIGVKSYKTYIKALNDLVVWGFIKMVEVSKNQYSANIVALVNFTEAHAKALDKALSKHSTKHTPKQVQSIDQSIDSIDKPLNNKPYNKQTNKQGDFIESNLDPFSKSQIAAVMDIDNDFENPEYPLEEAIEIFKSKYPKSVHVGKLRRALVVVGSENWVEIMNSLESYSKSLQRSNWAKSETDYIEGEFWKQEHKPYKSESKNGFAGRNFETVLKVAGIEH